MKTAISYFVFVVLFPLLCERNSLLGIRIYYNCFKGTLQLLLFNAACVKTARCIHLDTFFWERGCRPLTSLSKSNKLNFHTFYFMQPHDFFKQKKNINQTQNIKNAQMLAGVAQQQKRLFPRKSSSTVKTLAGKCSTNSKKACMRAKVEQRAKTVLCAQKQHKQQKKACVRAGVTQEQKRLYPRKSSTKQQNAYMCAQKQHKQQKSLYAHIHLLKMDALIRYLAHAPSKNLSVFSHFFLNTFFQEKILLHFSGFFHLSGDVQVYYITATLVCVTLCLLYTMIAFLNWRRKLIYRSSERYGAFIYTGRNFHGKQQ